jgi:hypothetical protein
MGRVYLLSDNVVTGCIVWRVYLLSDNVVTGCIVWRVYLLSDNVVTGCNKQTYNCIPFVSKGLIYSYRLCFISHTSGLCLDPKHCITQTACSFQVSISWSCECWRKMSSQRMRPQLLQPSKISELIVGTDSDEVRMSSDISSVDFLNWCQGCHNLNRTTKQHQSSRSISSTASNKQDASESGQVIRFNSQ